MKYLFLLVLVFLGCANEPFYYYSGEAPSLNIVKKAIHSTVNIHTEGSGNGTGIVIKKTDKKAYILTCAHIFGPLLDFQEDIFPSTQPTTAPFNILDIINFQPKEKKPVDITIVSSRWVDGRKYICAEKATILFKDKVNDLCILKIDAENFECSVAKFKKDDKNPPPNGTEIYHVGNFLGIYDFSVTKGIVSHNSRGYIGEKYQCDINVTFGSSGGGIFNAQTGECIGIVQAASFGTAGALVISSAQIFRWAEVLDLKRFFN